MAEMMGKDMKAMGDMKDMGHSEEADIASIDEIIGMVNSGADQKAIVAKLENLKQSEKEEEMEEMGETEPTAEEEIKGIYKKAKEAQPA